MHFVNSCLLAVAIWGCASAQTFSMGNCDAVMETVNNFDKTRFAGKWYEIKKSVDLHKAEYNSRCYTTNFSLSQEDTYHVIRTFVPNQDNKTQSFSLAANADVLNKGKLTVHPGLIADEQPLWILDTDYNTYAVTYSCMDAHQGKLEYAWIISRMPTLDKDTLTKAEKVLESKNIKVEMITHIQNCE